MLKMPSPGPRVPHECHVIIEIPAFDGSGVKYEVDKDTGLLCVDRFISVAMHYPCNYGFIPSTLSQDGDPVDVLLLTPSPVQAGSMAIARPVGVLCMEDEAGLDNKVLMLPIEKACLEMAHQSELSDLPQILLDRIVHFFEQYKALEPNKWVKITGWEGREAAESEIISSIGRYQEA